MQLNLYVSRVETNAACLYLTLIYFNNSFVEFFLFQFNTLILASFKLS